MNSKRDFKEPWNFREQVNITPKEFELQVKDWLVRSATIPDTASFELQGILTGDGGEYKIDVLVKLVILGGAELTIVVECKHHKRKVERKDMESLYSKVQDSRASKGMLFSTSGFQRGAIEFARNKKIAAVAVIDGKWIYETKGALDANEEAMVPSWRHFPRFAAIMIQPTGTTISQHTIDDEQTDAICEFLSDS